MSPSLQMFGESEACFARPRESSYQSVNRNSRKSLQPALRSQPAVSAGLGTERSWDGHSDLRVTSPTGCLNRFPHRAAHAADQQNGSWSKLQAGRGPDNSRHRVVHSRHILTLNAGLSAFCGDKTPGHSLGSKAESSSFCRHFSES